MSKIIDQVSASRRAALGLLGGAALLAAGTTPASAAKLSQKAMGYQPTPNGDKKCSECNHYIDPGSCQLVDGDISPDGWCRLWAKKAA